MSRAVKPGLVLDVKASQRYRDSMKARLMNGAGNKFNLILNSAPGSSDNATGIIEGFGVLAMASLFPIIAVLLTGLFVQYKAERKLKKSRS